MLGRLAPDHIRMLDVRRLIPSPLRDVLEYEDVHVPGLLQVAIQRAPWPDEAKDLARDAVSSWTDSGRNRDRCVRWELYGLPGLGKSTLARTLTKVINGPTIETVLLPEAVPYAVRVLGIALTDLEPFLDRVNTQAEVLARAAAELVADLAPVGGPSLLIVRDPAYQQNECYRYVLHSLRDSTDPVGDLIRRLASSVVAGTWPEDLAEQIGAQLWRRNAALRLPPFGGWQLSQILLTTGDPLADLELSLERQRDGIRDLGLVTADTRVLAGYLATLRFTEAASRLVASYSLIDDPRRPGELILERAAEHTRRSLASTRPS